MTFDPVIPAVVLAVVAAILLLLRAVALRRAADGGRRALLRWSTTTVAMLLLVLAAARPISGAAAESEPAQQSTDGANVYIVVDRSADSAIPDVDGAPRMTAIRNDIRAIIEAHPKARFAVISFASRPAVDWPLSADTWSLPPVIDALNPYPGPAAAGALANAGAAANVLRYQLIAAGQQYPKAPNLVYYLGSGAGQTTVTQGVFDTSPVDGGAVLGYGRDEAGVDNLRAIADQLGLPYVGRAVGEPLPQTGPSDDQPDAATEATGATGDRSRVELYWVLTALAALLLLGEIYSTTRDFRRARATRKVLLP